MIYRGIVTIAIWSTLLTYPIFGSFEDLVQVNGFAKGFAITAESLGAESAYKNPAGITSIDNVFLMTTYTSQFENLSQTAGLSLGAPINDKFKISLNIPLTMTQDNPETINQGGQGLQIDSFNNYSTGAILSLGTSVLNDRIHLGASAVYRLNQLNKVKGNGLGFDAGVLINFSYATLGLSAQDIGSTTLEWENNTQETIAPRYNIGLKIPVEKTISILVDSTIEENQDNAYNIGAEISLSKNFTLMAGLRDIQSNESSLRIGTSLKTSQFSVFYSYSNHQELGANHRIGIQFF